MNQDSHLGDVNVAFKVLKQMGVLDRLDCIEPSVWPPNGMFGDQPEAMEREGGRATFRAGCGG